MPPLQMKSGNTPLDGDISRQVWDKLSPLDLQELPKISKLSTVDPLSFSKQMFGQHEIRVFYC